MFTHHDLVKHPVFGVKSHVLHFTSFSEKPGFDKNLIEAGLRVCPQHDVQ